MCCFMYCFLYFYFGSTRQINPVLILLFFNTRSSCGTDENLDSRVRGYLTTARMVVNKPFIKKENYTLRLYGSSLRHAELPGRMQADA